MTRESSGGAWRPYAWILGVSFVGVALTALIYPVIPPWAFSLNAPGEVDVETARKWPQVVWVDARGEAEFSKEHVPGAINLNENDWSDGVGRLLAVWKPGVPIVVYCGSASCGTSKAVAERLRGPEYGFEQVHVLDGGWEAYVRAR